MNRREILQIACVTSLLITGILFKPNDCVGQVTMDDHVEIQCVSLEGDPVEGAEVYVVQKSLQNDGLYTTFGPYHTDREGRAICPEPHFSDVEKNFDRWFYARVPGRLAGATRSVCWNTRDPINPEGIIKLQPSVSIEGELNVPEGFNPSDVAVRVQTVHFITGENYFDYDSFNRSEQFPGLDESLKEIFEVRPNMAGRFVFEDLPEHGRVYVLTKAVGLAEAQWMNSDNRVGAGLRLNVEVEGRLTGVVQNSEGEPMRNVEMAARLKSHGRRANPYLSTFSTRTDDEGKFELTGLPATEFHLSAVHPDGEFVVAPIENLIVESGETIEVSVEMHKSVQVTGKVVDEDGMPVEGAAISALANTDESPGLDDDVSDEEGIFHLQLPVGAAKLYFNGLPEGFEYPDPQIVAEIEILPDEPIDELNFTLKRQ